MPQHRVAAPLIAQLALMVALSGLAQAYPIVRTSCMPQDGIAMPPHMAPEGDPVSYSTAVSPDGRFAIFWSDRALTQDGPGLFVRDLLTGVPCRLAELYVSSRCMGGRVVDAQTGTAMPWLAYRNSTDGHIYVRPLLGGAAELISVGANGQCGGEPQISLDGRYVAFVSDSTSLVAPNTPPGKGVFVRDRLAGTTRCVQWWATPFYDWACDLVQLSGDGQQVLYMERLQVNDVLRYYIEPVTGDNRQDLADIIGVPYANLDALEGKTTVDMSADGRYIFYVWRDTQPVLIGGAEYNRVYAYRYDRQTGERLNLTVDPAGIPVVASYVQDLSASSDGRFATFFGYCIQGGSLVADANEWGHVYVRDCMLHTTRLVDRKYDTAVPGYYSYYSRISADGRTVVFNSGSAGDFNLALPYDPRWISWDIVEETYAVARMAPHLAIRAADTGEFHAGADAPGADSATAHVYPKPGGSAAFIVRLRPQVFVEGNVVLRGPAGGEGWTVAYYDAPEGGANITAAVTGTDGWSVPAPTAAPRDIRVVVSAAGTLPPDSLLNLDISAACTSVAWATTDLLTSYVRGAVLLTDIYEPNDAPSTAGAQQFALNTAQTHTHHLKADVDWSWFTVPASGGRVDITTTGGLNSLSLVLLADDGTGNPGTEVAVSGGTATPSLGQVLPAGRYFLRLSSFNQSCTSGPYTVALAFDAPPSVVVDSPCAQPGAAMIALGQPVALAATVADESPDTAVVSFALSREGQMAPGFPITRTGPLATADWTPDQPGLYTLTTTVTDASGLSSSAPVCTIRVNTPPVAHAQEVAVAEDASVVITLGSLHPAEEGQTLTFQVTALPGHGSLNQPLAMPFAGQLTYTPDENYSGPDSFAFTVSDGINDSAQSATVSVNVTPVNDAPVAVVQTGTATVLTPEDTAALITLVGTDVDGDPLTYTLGTDADAPQHGVLTGTAPYLTYTPAPDYFGPDQFTFTVSDGQFACTATVAIVVASENDVPVVVSLPAADRTTAEDCPLLLTLTATHPANEGQTVAFRVVAGPTHGSVSAITPAGSTASPYTATVLYTPAQHYHGPDAITVVASDGDADGPAFVMDLTVTPVNDAPVATPLTVPAFDEDTSVVLSLAGTDADQDTLQVVVTGLPTHGTLVREGQPVTAGVGFQGDVTYTPASDYAGTDTFAFTVTDGVLTSDPMTVTLTITPVNDTPVVQPVALTVLDGMTHTVDVAASDVEAGALTFTVSAPGPAKGTATFAADVPGRLTYTAATGVAGSDTFTVAVTDADGAVGSATVSVTIQSREIIVDDADDTGVTFTGTWTLRTPTPSAGQWSDTYRDDGAAGKGGRSVTFTPTLPAAGNYEVFMWWPATMTSPATSIPVEVRSLMGVVTKSVNQSMNGGQWVALGTYPLAAGANTPTGSVLIKNNGTTGYVAADAVRFVRTLDVDSPPVAISETIFAYEDGPTVTGVIKAADADGQPLSFVRTSATPTRGAFSLRADGSYDFTPYRHSSGTEPIAIQVTSGGQTVTATLTVTVRPLDFYLDNTEEVINTYAAAPVLGLTGRVAQEPAGTWQLSTTPSGFIGTSCLTTISTTTQPTTARYTLTVPVSGSWTLYIRYSASTNRATNVPVTITHATGTTPRTINQTTGGGTWVSLGGYTLSRLTPTVIEISTTGTADGSVVVADAIRFIKTTTANSAPVITNTTITTPMNTPVSGTWPITDAQDDPLTITPTVPANGWLVQGPAQAYTYVPFANTVGPDPMVLTASDGIATPVTGTLTVTVPTTDDVIVDNLDGAPAVTAVGTWSTSSTSTSYYNNSAWYVSAAATSSKTVTFRPNLATAGTYTVSIWYGANTNRCPAVPVTITHAGGTATLALDQRSNGSRWVTLGTYSFTAGTDGTVTIASNSASGGLVIADAVRFTRMSGDADHLQLHAVSAAELVQGQPLQVQVLPYVPADLLTWHGGLAPTSYTNGLATFDTATLNGTYTISVSAFGLTTPGVTTTVYPPLGLTGPMLVNLGTPAQFTASEPGVTWSVDPADGSTIVDGLFTPVSHGGYTLTVTRGMRTATRSVSVNALPRITGAPVETPEDTPTTFTLEITHPAEEAGQTISCTIVTHPAHGTLSGTFPTLTYTPHADYSGDDAFCIRASDGLGDGPDTTITITVTEVNDSPTFTCPEVVTVDEDAAGYVEGFITDLDPRELGQTVTFTVTPDDPDLFEVLPSIVGTTLVFTPKPNQVGSCLLTITATDDGTPPATSAARTTAIVLVSQNDAPTIVAPVPLQQEVGQNAAHYIAGLQLADVDAGSALVELTLTATHGTVSLTGTGLTYVTGDGTDDPVMVCRATLEALNAALTQQRVLFMPAMDYVGTDAAVTVTVSDLGATGQGGALTASLTIPISVTANP